MATITKIELIDRITEKTQSKHFTVKTVVHQFLGEIVSELTKGNRLEFRDFGIFEVREQTARTAQNPKTTKPVQVPARRRVKFKMGRLMREGMNNKGVIK